MSAIAGLGGGARGALVLLAALAGCGSSPTAGAGGASGTAATGGSAAGGATQAGGGNGGGSPGTSGGAPGPAASGRAGSGGQPVVGVAGAGGAGGSGGTGAAGTLGAAGRAGATGSADLAFAADRVIVTGVRGTGTPPATSVIALHNAGNAPARITGLSLAGTARLALGAAGMPVQASAMPVAGASLFQLVNPPSLPATIAAGGDLTVTIQVLTTAANLPAPPADKNSGATFLSTTLTASTAAGTAQAAVYGLVLTQANYEPTLGQILIALGHKLNVGQAQTNWNPNTSSSASSLPGVENGTDEVSAPLFVKAGSGMVTLTVVARFSPAGVLPYGWYPAADSTHLNTVGTMSMVIDPQTSDKARMVGPPLQAGSATAFDPGTTPFGIWVFSDQKTEKYNEGGNTVNGDLDYSQDALNAPAGAHRVKVYPVKDAGGVVVAQRYLLAVEEAGNGDYQDYVLLLGNVNVAAGGGTGAPGGCSLPATVSFQRDVEPILVPSCGGGNGCHVVDASATTSSGGYDHAYDWITAGAHPSSCPETPTPKRFQIVLDVIQGASPATCAKSRVMPPQNETGANLRQPLTACQIATLQGWLSEPLVTQPHRVDDTDPAGTGPFAMPPFN